ncbi:ATP-binding protein [Streptomyces caelestis]|uniref:ATP-binding protein n=2 Tax=Streptomyces caelestis TaxID=36816 RepID=UPI00369B9433
MAGSAWVAHSGEPQALDWGLAMGVSFNNFAAAKIHASSEGLARTRAFTRSCLRQWNLEAVSSDVIAVVGELTANAVRHGLSAEADPWLALATSPRSVMCIAWDPSPELPEPRTAGLIDPDGRGLAVIAGLSALWGWSREGPGKAVWAHVPI